MIPQMDSFIYGDVAIKPLQISLIMYCTFKY